jgi:hypothetical protein
MDNLSWRDLDLFHGNRRVAHLVPDGYKFRARCGHYRSAAHTLGRAKVVARVVAKAALDYARRAAA